MHTMLTLLLTAQSLGQIGGLSQAASPVSFVAPLSRAGDDASPPMLLYVYHLEITADDHSRPTAAEVAGVVRELLASADWSADGAYIKAVNNRLVVRHRPDVQRRVVALLVELRAIDLPDSPRRGGGGFGCGCVKSVIPIVGEKSTSRTEQR